MKTTKNLFDYYTRPIKKAKLVGVIIDATRPYKTEKAPDFTTKIKIIDESLNCATNVSNPKKYIHIFVFSKTLKESPDITQIGDIIYLKHYDLEQFSGNNEVKAKKRGSFSKYYVFDGNPENPNDFEKKQSDDIEEYEAKPGLQLRIQELRRWSKIFFSKQSLTKMNWFGKLVINTMLNNQTVDFDMILRLKNIKATNNNALVVFELNDGKNQSFFLQYSKENDFKVGDVMKIRSIIKLGQNGDLFPNSYSSIMKLPLYYYDVVNFNKDFNYQVIYDKPQPQQDIEGLIEENVIERKKEGEYNPESDLLSTIIKKEYFNLELTRNITTLKQIIELNDKFKLKRISMEEMKTKLFRVQCYIFDINPEELKDALKSICIKCKKISNFILDEQKHCCNMANQIIWQIRLAVKDVSIDDEVKFLELYVCDFDGNGSDVFKGISPKMIKSINFEESSKKYKNIVQNILDLSSIDYMSEFIIEPMAFRNEVIYRIIDTKFNQQ